MAQPLQVKTPLLNSIKTPLLEGKSRDLLDFNASFGLLGLGNLWITVAERAFCHKLSKRGLPSLFILKI